MSNKLVEFKNLMSDFNKSNTNKKNRPVVAMGRDNNCFLFFKSIAEASIVTLVPASKISLLLSGRINNNTAYIFSYADE